MPQFPSTQTAAPVPGPTAALIYDDWYPALRTSTLKRGKLATAMLLDIPLVLGRRNDGRVFAMRDSCPHRGIPLSYGWFDGDRVTCRYHGWEFEPCSGQVRAPGPGGYDPAGRRTAAQPKPMLIDDADKPAK